MRSCAALPAAKLRLGLLRCPDSGGVQADVLLVLGSRLDMRQTGSETAVFAQASARGPCEVLVCGSGVGVCVCARARIACVRAGAMVVVAVVVVGLPLRV